jgi:hypothetical protein
MMPVYDGVDYDVLFDGAHHNCDDDLLNRVDAVEKRPAPHDGRAHRATGDMSVRVFDALPDREAGGITIETLMARTGLARSTVYVAIDLLRRRGRLESTPIAGGRRFQHPPQWYWRSREASSDTNEAIVVDAVRAWLHRE